MQENSQLIIILIVVFTICLFLLGIFFFMLINKYYTNLKREQRDALTNLIIGQDNERIRIARDLHDEMGPTLSGIVFRIDKIETIDSNNSILKDKIKTDLNLSIKRIRQITHNLASFSLSKFGLVDAIEDFIANQDKEKLKVEFTSELDNVQIQEVIQSNLFRIIQELFYNTQKHSEATSITISMKYNSVNKELCLEYTDNGKGFNSIGIIHGIGLKNITTRVGLMNGVLEIDGLDGFNLRILININ